MPPAASLPRGVAVRAACLLTLVLAPILLAPAASGAPSVGEAVTGRGRASGFFIMGGGSALEGGAFHWTLVCSDCTLRITFRETSFDHVGSDGLRGLPPGEYRVSGFAGLIAHTMVAPGDYRVEMHGTGEFVRL